MEISSVIEHDSYALIGGGQARPLGMSDSSEGFHILSDTLYKHKKLAAIREVLCNAYDAHVEAGVERPVEVTITADSFEVRDFGRGIPDHMMIPVYGTYFASTKKKDGRLIGGFGLGSKSPFAYSQHFVATSRHEGQSCTYVVTVGSEETEGRPAMRLMGKGPTDETGVTVSMPLLNEQDANEFIRICKRLAWEGGMKVLLNGELLPTLDVAAIIENGYGMVPQSQMQHRALPGALRASVLFGNILYPLDIISEFAASMRKLEDYQAGLHLIVYAPPSSVRPIPSREGLSYNKQTVKTLATLLADIVQELNKTYEPIRSLVVKEHFQGKAPDRFALHEWLRLPPIEVELLASAESICRNTAIRAFNNGTRDRKLVRSLILQRTPMNRRSLSRKLGMFCGPDDLMAEARRLRWRRMIRAIVKAGVMEHTVWRQRDLYGGSHRSVLEPFQKAKFERTRGTKNWQGAVAIVWNSNQVREITSGVVLNRHKLTQEQVDGFIAACKRFGFNHIFQLPKPVRKVKEIVKKTVVTPAAYELPRLDFSYSAVESDLHGFQFNDLGAQRVRPTHHLALVGGFRDGKQIGVYPVAGEDLHTALAHVMPDARIGVTLGVLERKRAVKEGVRDVYDDFMEILRKRPALRGEDAFYAKVSWLIVDAFRDRGWQTHVGRLCGRSRKLTCQVFGKPYKESKELDHAYWLWIAAHKLFLRTGRRQFPDLQNSLELYERHNKLEAEYRDLFSKDAGGKTAATNLSAGYEHLNGLFKLLDTDKFNSHPEEELAAVLDWHWTRHRRALKQKDVQA